MITTSRDWKVALGCYQVPNRDRLVPINDIKIEYEQIDATAQNSATVAVNTATSWGNPSGTNSDVMNLSLDYSTQSPVATLEANEWVLDGSMIFSDVENHNGWVSESLSGCVHQHHFTLVWDYPEASIKLNFEADIQPNTGEPFTVKTLAEWLIANGKTGTRRTYPATGYYESVGETITGIYGHINSYDKYEIVVCTENYAQGCAENERYKEAKDDVNTSFPFPSASYPKLTLTWSSVQTTKIPCVSIWFSSLLDEWASEFSIKAYNGASAVYSANFVNDKVTDAYGSGFSGYDKVEIEITKWCLPNRHARIENICMGFVDVLGKGEIMNAEQGMTSDLLTFTLPDDYFTFEIDNVGEEWNPDNPTGRYAYLLERQRVNVKYAFKINGNYEWHTVGTYFMSEWTTPQNGITASFTARSLIDFMTKQFNPSSITGYTYGDEISLKELATKAFQQANLPIDADGSAKYVVCDELDDIDVVIPYTESEVEGVTTYAWDFNYTCAEVIQLCANAGCAVIRPDTNGTIHIEMPSSEVTDYYIDRFVSYSNGEYENAKALKTININDGALIYTPSESVETGEEQSIQNCLIQSSAQRTACASWMADLLLKRKSISGEFRADPRLQPMDVVTVVNKYTMNIVKISEVKWSYGGSFSGNYVGKVLKSIPLIDQMGEFFTNATYTGNYEYGG